MTDDVTTPEVTTPTQKEDLTRVLSDLHDHITKNADLVSVLQQLVEADTFQHLSKISRNALMAKLTGLVSATEDTTKAAYRQLKKIKRVRPEESLVDAQLIIVASNFESSVHQQTLDFIGAGFVEVDE